MILPVQLVFPASAYIHKNTYKPLGNNVYGEIG